MPDLTSRPDSDACLAELCRAARVEIVKAVGHAQAGHLGGPLSAVEMLCALYFRILNVEPDAPQHPDRDRFVLSKGHSSIALYAVLALRGYLPVDELITFDAVDSRLQGHPDMTALPGVDMSSGSLRLGFSAAVGIALGAKLSGRSFRTYVMLGDGECNEGIVWEGADLAARHDLNNLIAVVDMNGLQQHGRLDPESDRRLPPYAGTQLRDRWTAFGWRVLEVDGHDVGEVTHGLAAARRSDQNPTVVLSHTVKGKGVSFMENQPVWHSRPLTPDELERALAELQGAS